MGIYNGMAHFVAEKLNIRPNEILDEWCVQELIVAYGYYANQISKQNYEQWKSLDARARGKIERPEEIAVKFFGVEDIEE